MIFHHKIQLRKLLNVLARYATITHPRGRVNCCFAVLIWGGMWLAKVARRGENLVQYLKILLDIVLDAKTFGASGKSDF